jgi:cytochrome c-type biogenesis protein CcmH/NrfG
MAMTKRAVNLLLAGIVVILATVAAYSVYMKLEHPVVRAPLVPNAASSEISENRAAEAAADRLAALEEMILKDPQNAQIRTQLGNVYYDLGQYRKAIDAYQESLKLQPNDPNVETDEATCYHYLGQHDKALEILDKVLAYRPNFSQAMFNKGVVLIKGNDKIQDGIAVWETLLRTNPDFPQKAEVENMISRLRQSAK